MHNRAAFAALIFYFCGWSCAFRKSAKMLLFVKRGRATAVARGRGSRKNTHRFSGEKGTFTGGKRRLLLFPLFCGKKSTPSRRDKKSRILYNISAEKHSVLIFILE